MTGIILLLLSSLIISCSHYSPIYWGWGEWTGPGLYGVEDNSRAGFDWSKHPGVITSIDGNNVGDGYKKAKLSPGRHVIQYAAYPAEFGAHPKGTVEIDLQADHVYEFGLKLCYWCKPRSYAVWVDDRTTGELVWGKRPDWPSWFL